MNLGFLPHVGLVILDVDKRAYVAERKSSGTFHFVQPAGEEHPAVHDGKVQVGDLACICPGGMFHGTCWATDAAKEFERELAEDIAWGLKPSSMADGLPENERSSEQSNPVSATPAEPVPA